MKFTPPLSALTAALVLFTSAPAQAYTLYYDDDSSGNFVMRTVTDDDKETVGKETFELKKIRVWVFKKKEDYPKMLSEIQKKTKKIEKWTDAGFAAIDVTGGVVGGVVGGVLGAAAGIPTAGTASAFLAGAGAGLGGAAGGALTTVTTMTIQKTIDPAKLIARSVKHDIEDKYTLNYGDVQPGSVISERIKDKHDNIYIVLTAHGDKTVPLLQFTMKNTGTAAFSINKDDKGALVAELMGHDGEVLMEGSFSKEDWKQLPKEQREKIKQNEKDYRKAVKAEHKRHKDLAKSLAKSKKA